MHEHYLDISILVPEVVKFSKALCIGEEGAEGDKLIVLSSGTLLFGLKIIEGDEFRFPLHLMFFRGVGPGMVLVKPWT